MPMYLGLFLTDRTVLFSFAILCAGGCALAQSKNVQADSTLAGPSKAGSDLRPTRTLLSDILNQEMLPPISAGDGGATSRSDSDRFNPFRRVWSYIGDHIALDLGAGFNAPLGNDIPYITWGGNFTIGGGVHLNKRLTLLAEYQFISDKLPGSLIANAGTEGGHAHIWSFTLDPVIDLFPSRRNSIYLTGGGGFYRKVTSFTDPSGYQNYVVGHFSSNQGGASFGLGVTHELRWESGTRVFAESRYLFLDTPPITETNGLGTTELIPVTIGVRW